VPPVSKELPAGVLAWTDQRHHDPMLRKRRVSTASCPARTRKARPHSHPGPPFTHACGQSAERCRASGVLRPRRSPGRLGQGATPRHVPRAGVAARCWPADGWVPDTGRPRGDGWRAAGSTSCLSDCRHHRCRTRAPTPGGFGGGRRRGVAQERGSRAAVGEGPWSCGSSPRLGGRLASSCWEAEAWGDSRSMPLARWASGASTSIPTAVRVSVRRAREGISPSLGGGALR